MPEESRSTSTVGKPQILGIAAGAWLTRSRGRLNPGSPGKWIVVPQMAAEELLQRTTRLVADLPRSGSRDVIWVSGTNELQVSTNAVRLECSPGLLKVTIPVFCDQMPKGKPSVTVPFAVGTRQLPRGLLMSTLMAPSGPPVVTDVWADSLIAFAWESLLTLAREVAKAAGYDRSGRVLTPLAIGAEQGRFLVQPRAAHAS